MARELGCFERDILENMTASEFQRWAMLYKIEADERDAADQQMRAVRGAQDAMQGR